MQALSLSTQVLLRMPRCRRTSSSSSSRSTGEGWDDSSIGWHLLINSEATIEDEIRTSDEYGVFSSNTLINQSGFRTDANRGILRSFSSLGYELPRSPRPGRSA